MSSDPEESGVVSNSETSDLGGDTQQRQVSNTAVGGMKNMLSRVHSLDMTLVNSAELHRFRTLELINQGERMLHIIRENVAESAPLLVGELEIAVLCYSMVRMHLEDYFNAFESYRTLDGFQQKHLKWWPDTMFRRVAHMIFSVLEGVEIHTLEYFVNVDNLRQVFRHLIWANLLFNWRLSNFSTIYPSELVGQSGD